MTARDVEKPVGLEPLPATLDMLLMLVNEGKEVRTVVNCFDFELGSSGSLAAAASVTVKKRKVTKGIFVIRWLKMLLGHFHFELDQVKGWLGHFAGLGLKPKGLSCRNSLFKPNQVSKSF
jgi:hypothetical protein